MNKKYTGIQIHLYVWLFVFYSVNTPSASSQEDVYRLKTVVIDAGHGGKDPGSPGRHTNEKDVVLAIALKLGQYIEKQVPGVRVIYTRTTDVFVPLHQRAEIANSNKADLFISIHANGNHSSAVSGTESLVLGLHRAGENFEVAKKENGVILLEDDYNTRYEGFDPNSPESYIIFSLMQNLYFEQSINLAGLVQEQFRERAQRKDRGVKQQGLLVLARTSMPGILIETGFITNLEEEQYLMSEEGQDYIASAIFRAFRAYKNLIESKASFAVAVNTGGDKGGGDSARGSTAATGAEPVRADTLKSVENQNPAVEFKVQIAASSRKLNPGSPAFRGLTGIAEYHTGTMYKYAVGSSKTFQEIITYSKPVKERFPDAFIIAIKDNKIIPLDQALRESQQSIPK